MHRSLHFPRRLRLGKFSEEIVSLNREELDELTRKIDHLIERKINRDAAMRREGPIQGFSRTLRALSIGGLIYGGLWMIPQGLYVSPQDVLESKNRFWLAVHLLGCGALSAIATLDAGISCMGIVSNWKLRKLEALKASLDDEYAGRLKA